MMDFCCQIVATRDFDHPETLILCRFPDFSLYSHSMHINYFCFSFVLSALLSFSDSTDYLYSSACTARSYHFFISVIKSRPDCGILILRGDYSTE